MAEPIDEDFPSSMPRSFGGRRLSFSRSSDDGDSGTSLTQPSPTLKRAATTSSATRAARYLDLDSIPNLPLMPPPGAAWNSPPSSLIGAQRRPSLVEVYERSRRRGFQSDSVLHATTDARFQDPPHDEPHSPEDGTNFKRSLEINMKDLVGDAVGNMSISPSSRDIVLAARKGLFIIDLEHPFEVPRFLPQGGTWDVADVQWNPHPSRSQYIVSTSSEKMLIWNLGITGKTSIEHILKSHYRAITDFNWHTTECDVVASTGIDSWIWVWDMRNPRKPAFGLSAFQAAGTQVKWNRQDGNYLASAHGNEVLIWDRRKGSLPVTQIKAHSAKIYGIDWSHHLRNEIVTCSLDMTIKSWDISAPERPTRAVQTNYPVWRARNLPFGQGILSLPQRGETRLEMYARTDHPTPVEIFEGHSDVVKEFVWRKGGPDEFQLITWSKDRTLRFWPVTTDIMQKVGHTPEVTRGRSQRVEREPTLSYRSPPENEPIGGQGQQLLSAPIGNRAILAEVRAGPVPRNLITQPHPGSSARGGLSELNQRTPTLTDTKPIAVASRTRGGTMSRGAVTGKSVAGMDAFTWLANVKVGNKRGSSSGAGSNDPSSSSSSRLGSTSRNHSSSRGEGESNGGRQRSVSRTRGPEDRRDNEDAQSLQDEITSVLKKLHASKIKLEKHDLTKKRTCTLGLHGPWGESSSVFVFMRLTFTFPSKYPQSGHPEGTPSVELERNPLISPRDRAYILKRLKAIRETKRPCLEACLRFLLFAEDGLSGRVGTMDSDTSDEDDADVKKRGKEMTVSILRNHKNLAEPRTSQGAFGPNGELICFFRAPPRIVRNVLRGLTTDTPGDEQQNQQTIQQQESLQQSRLFQSPALVSDAIRRLRLSARDQLVLPVGKQENDINILRTMTNLLTVSQHKIRRDSGGSSKNWSLLPTRRSNVFMMDTMSIAGPDKEVAAGYVFQGDSLAQLCEENAGFARECGRYDHERVFRMLRSLFNLPRKADDGEKEVPVDANAFVSDMLAIRVIQQIYDDLAKNKDIQMLAMLSVMVLQTPHGARKPASIAKPKPELPIAPLPPLKTGGMDYFTLARTINNVPSPLSPAWPSPGAPPHAPSVASSNSSRGSWSSLFNTGSVRQLMTGLQDGLTTPNEFPMLPNFLPEPISKQNSMEKMVLTQASGSIQKKRSRKDSSRHSPSSTMSKSWNEGRPQTPRNLSVSFSSAGHKRSGLLRLQDISPIVQEKRRIVFETTIEPESPPPTFSDSMIQQFHRHIYAYAELLFRWELYTKRLELLNSARHLDPPADEQQHRIGLVRRCPRPDCSAVLDEKTQRAHSDDDSYEALNLD
ncbi:vacuolar membrane protein [Coprinopsis cinerea okayama7|uniref:Vacuolar membrane protein n=1 Tax=Coprinopsis cinerea (strain Okayama-7 / 130 / ATCC MYA-4618 / FGSC 9003) TaxID=240176 RepID=A8N0A3_COPC7|nr:vacuolar membrane protein [Coprinopsis cinerea okayama7\|eukprot:XP_001828291.2 vacuolar membrane protein [Coprinopsis cinerea okayama7\